MDVSRYNFLCQKALHQGLQYARSFGHQSLEVEHIALALLRGEAISLPGRNDIRLQQLLQNYLSQQAKMFGEVQVDFGRRLDLALDVAEKQVGANLVDEQTLWAALRTQSPILSDFLQVQDANSNDDFAALGVERSLNPEDPAGDSDSGESKRSTEGNQGKGKLEDKAVGSTYKIDEKLEKALKDYTVDLSELAERGDLDPVIGRDFETRRVLEILGRKKKNNPILIGEPGVGKTAVVEAIAFRIAKGQVPDSLKGKRILSLDLSALVAGAKFRGEFEQRLKDLLAAVEACGGDILLFIDEIHMLVGAGGSEGTADAANMMKPALARGELNCIGATTLDEYRTHIEKDPALERRFQSVMVEEPARGVAISILRGIKSHYAVHHGVQIDDEALVAAVDLSMRYLPGRRLPDKAIDLIDEACSRLRLQIDSMPAVLDDLRSHVAQLEIEKNALGPNQKAKLDSLEQQLGKIREEYKSVEKIWQDHKILLEELRKLEGRRSELNDLYSSSKTKDHFDFAAKLQYEEIPKVELRLTQIRKKLERSHETHSWLRQIVGSIEIAEVIGQWTGIPVNRLLKDEAQHLLDMEKRLAKRVFGQDKALQAVGRAVRRARVGVNDPNRPLGIFLFLGPSGVGKTETAKALAAEIFDDETRMVRIDMSEYMEQHAVARLIGSPPGYVGYGEGGELTEPVRRHPFTVVLFDEIEKAHPRILDILLQTFDDGRLSDSKGRVVDFRNTLLVLTSNLPVELKPKLGSLEADEDIRRQLTAHLRPELIGRIDEVVRFNSLGSEQLDLLLGKLLGALNERLADQQIHLHLGENLRQKLMSRAESGVFGARALRRSFQQWIVDRTAERILNWGDKARGDWTLDLEGQNRLVWTPTAPPEVNLKKTG